ncbi:hypothetical protein Baya_2501 [Bagarius yarrelli]|uniref:Uncharacterized protein n=1 Tax=Bagarius yarrelli TaxID=175774 RepID=A0A556TP45_BAGYA|nr:hypothetical protein Baya_2501 [Bagarius yarrelli]
MNTKRVSKFSTTDSDRRPETNQFWRQISTRAAELVDSENPTDWQLVRHRTNPTDSWRTIKAGLRELGQEREIGNQPMKQEAIRRTRTSQKNGNRREEKEPARRTGTGGKKRNQPEEREQEGRKGTGQ